MIDGNVGVCGLYEVSEKRKDKTRHATVVYEDTWLEPWNCLLLCNVAAGQWAGNPAKMKSVIVSGTASMDQCPLAVNELTLCFNQNWAIWMEGIHASSMQLVLSSQLEKYKPGVRQTCT